MTTEWTPLPPGAVSTIRGRWQAPALRWSARVLAVLAVGGLLIPGWLGDTLQVAAVGVVVAVPLARVAWLVLRWAQERDWLFVLLGIALLVVIGAGALAAAL